MMGYKSVPAELEIVEYERGLGILLPVFSLPSPGGIGTLGAEAYEFVDLLVRSGVRYWQILPLGPTSFGDSPYASFSAVAGNPYFIDLRALRDDGLLTDEEIAAADCGDDPERVDYGALYERRYIPLHTAFERMKDAEKEKRYWFRQANAGWLEDYALFMTIKKAQGGAPWIIWPKELRDRDPVVLERFRAEHAEEIDFHCFMQYYFFEQWGRLRKYANDRGIQIIGDIPIYVAGDSVEVWKNREDFLLDDEGRPIELAGAPPDPYNMDGQLWGNPVYDWAHQQADGYGFWERRLLAARNLYDIVRLDHFIGFYNYWSVPAGESTAAGGRWVLGPGFDFFKTMEEKLGPLPILVEDLGSLSDGVRAMRDRCGFPGMKPLQFAFGDDNTEEYRPHRHVARSAVYTSTHDSSPLLGWWNEADEETKRFAREYFDISIDKNPIFSILRGAAASVAAFCVFSMQDVLELGEESRINRPGIIGGNWTWRLKKDYAASYPEAQIKKLARLYGRTQ